MSGNRDGARVFLFLQGPTNLLFAGVAQHLRRLGHRTCRIHVCAGDHLFWRGPKAVRFVGRVDEWPDFISRFYRENGVTDLVLLGEQRHLHRVAIDLARPHEAPGVHVHHWLRCRRSTGPGVIVNTSEPATRFSAGAPG